MIESEVVWSASEPLRFQSGIKYIWEFPPEACYFPMWERAAGNAQAEQDRLTALPTQLARLKAVQDATWLCTSTYVCSNTSSAVSDLLACHHWSIVHKKRSLPETFRTLVVVLVTVLIELLQTFLPTFAAFRNREHCVWDNVWFQRSLRLHSVFFSTMVSCVTLFCVQPLLYTGFTSNPRLWPYYFSCFLRLDSQIKQEDDFFFVEFGDFGSL